MTDRWHRWLLDLRHGGDPEHREKLLTGFLYPVRDTVLDRARLSPGETLLDVGTGDGLIAFGALERLGPSGRVIFSDISQDLLDHCRAAATAEGLLDRCEFVLAPADDLGEVTADVITTRSVLIYVKDKERAFREFRRVLKPGGRISLFEPINVLMSVADPSLFWGYEIGQVRDLADKIEELYRSIQPLGVDPMVDFDERDLVRHAERAGFTDIDLALKVTVQSSTDPMRWDQFVRSSPNPLIPPLADAMDQLLSPDEAERFTQHLRPLVESGHGRRRMALAYLTAQG
jgi:arsenite methyltransferase